MQGQQLCVGVLLQLLLAAVVSSLEQGISVTDTQEYEEAWRNFSRKLRPAAHLQPGCTCTGAWESFRGLFNWTLVHADPTGSFPASTAAARLCNRHALPLIRSALGEDYLTVDLSNLKEHECPAGLVSALSLCAAVHAVATEHTPKEQEPAIWGVDAKSGSFSWAKLSLDWRTQLPADCQKRQSCLAVLEGMLVLAASPFCSRCLPFSLWPLDISEVQDNVMRLLLWHQSPMSSRSNYPPRWKGMQPSRWIKSSHRHATIGAFTMGVAPEQVDKAGIRRLVVTAARSWTPHDCSLGESPWCGRNGRAAELFKLIYGPLAEPFDIGARGPLSVEVKLHPKDFAGPRAGLSFYVYDLPRAAHAHLLNALHSFIRETTPEPSNCNYGLGHCTEQQHGGEYSFNRIFAAEVTFLAKLLSAPTGVITEDPTTATYFVVPFFSSVWCSLASRACWVRCANRRPLNEMLPLLTYYNVSTAHRHLFLAADSTGDLPLDMQLQPLVLSYGPSPCQRGTGPLIAPPPVTDELPLLGPQEFASKDLLVFAADGLSSRPYRREAIQELEKWQRRFPELFAVAQRDLAGKQTGSPTLWAQLIRRAVFCPVLPGDNSFRLRLFHAVLVGCIPVVVAFPGGGWYRAHGPSVEQSLPFAHTGLDWHRLALELPFDPATQEFGAWAKRLVPSMLELGVDGVRQRQLELARAARMLRYDFRGAHPDAFTMLLNELAERAAAPQPAQHILECFDPRLRFDTNRSLSGFSAHAQAESEVYGIIACCPVAVAAAQDHCDAGGPGWCVKLARREEEAFNSLTLAVLERRRFDATLPGDDVC